MTRPGRARSREGARRKRRKKVVYGKRTIWHSKESSKGVEELAENSPFPLAPEEGDLSGEGVV